MNPAALAQCWTFRSSSGSRSYQTLLYADGTTSCDCPGWCKRVAGDGSRSCRHTRSVVMGTAGRECENTHAYQGAAPTVSSDARPAAGRIDQFGQLGRRKIQT